MALTDWKFFIEDPDPKAFKLAIRYSHVPSGRSVNETIDVPASAGATWLNDTLARRSVELEKLGQSFIFLNNLAVGEVIVSAPTPPSAGTYGDYRAATSLINGSTSAQNLASIENPSGSSGNIRILRITVSGAVGAIATAQFLYHIGHTTALPTAGTILTAQPTNEQFPAPFAVVRQVPTATASPGDLWTGQASPLITAAGQDLSLPLQMQDEIVLAPGEAVLVRADANTAGWRHNVNFAWMND